MFRLPLDHVCLKTTLVEAAKCGGVSESGGRSGLFRVLPAVLVSLSVGNYLPSDLSELAVVFGSDERYNFSVKKLSRCACGIPCLIKYRPTQGAVVLEPLRRALSAGRKIKRRANCAGSWCR
jgi:hypothetical protein